MIRPKPVDMRSLTLSAEEGFVLSRIDSQLSLRELVAVCGFEEERVTEIVMRLAAEGAVELDPDAQTPTPTPVLESGFRPPAPSFAGIDELGEMSGDEELSALVIAVSGVSDVGVVRSNNEDAFAVMDLTSGALIDLSAPVRGGALEVGSRGVLLVVSDGMGGQNAGEVASALTLETIEKHLAPKAAADRYGDDAATRLAAAVADANVRVAEAADVPGRTGMGATVVALLIEGTTAYSAEVGDSRAYVLRRGTLTRITKDQTQIQILLDQGLLTPETAASSRAKNIVLQAIGKTPDLVVAQRRLGLHHGDRLLLCSDGLTGHVADPEIGQMLGSPASLAEICAQLVKLTNERGGRDNVTVLAAEITSASPGGRDGSVAETMATIREFSPGEGAPP